MAPKKKQRVSQDAEADPGPSRGRGRGSTGRGRGSASQSAGQSASAGDGTRARVNDPLLTSSMPRGSALAVYEAGDGFRQCARPTCGVVIEDHPVSCGPDGSKVLILTACKRCWITYVTVWKE